MDLSGVSRCLPNSLAHISPWCKSHPRLTLKFNAPPLCAGSHTQANQPVRDTSSTATVFALDVHGCSLLLKLVESDNHNAPGIELYLEQCLSSLWLVTRSSYMVLFHGYHTPPLLDRCHMRRILRSWKNYIGT